MEAGEYGDVATLAAAPAISPTASQHGALRTATIAFLVLGFAIGLAWTIRAIQAPLGEQTERAVIRAGALLAAVLVAIPAVYVLRARLGVRPEVLSLMMLSALGTVLLACYFFWVSWYVFFPADIWIWSEGDYVNDMIKFVSGYPIYSAPASHDSYTYVPGSQLLTYFLARLAGRAWSIPAYRVVQVGYTAAAALVATLSCREILRLARPTLRVFDQWYWTVFAYTICLLVATNSITNRFTHNLHDDALAQLVNMIAMYLLLRYIESGSGLVLAAMAVLPGLGFLVKQNILIWGVLYGGFLLIWGRSWKHFWVFGAVAASLFGAVLASCFAIWGQPFYYYIFYLLSHHSVSLLRSFQHILDTWVFYAALLLGGVAVFWGRRPDALTGAWLASIALIFVETYTSGIAWMLNHIGPGSLAAGIWFLAGVATVWDVAIRSAGSVAESWVRTAVMTAAVALVCSGMGFVRIPLRQVSDDAYRYATDIEKQFEGERRDRVLLDVGTWVYVRDRVVMGDRAPVVGEEGYAKSGDFSGFLGRLQAHHYSKILVRDLHEPDFWYENSQWPRPRGLRDALLESYQETGRIRAAAAPRDVKKWAQDPYLFDEITILEPKPAPDIPR